MPMRHWLLFWSLAFAIIVVSYAAFSTCDLSRKESTYNGSLPTSSTIQTSDTPPTAIAPAVKSGRKVFDPSEPSSNGSELSASDLTALNHEAPNLTVTYTNKTYHVAVDIPYNFNWGKPDYVLEPFQMSGDHVISYGTLEMLEGAIGRSQSLTIDKKMTVEQARTMIKDRPMNGTPKESTVRGIPVISYQAKDIPCRIVIGVGKTATYRFQDCRDDIPQLEPEAILATIHAAP